MGRYTISDSQLQPVSHSQLPSHFFVVVMRRTGGKVMRRLKSCTILGCFLLLCLILLLNRGYSSFDLLTVTGQSKSQMIKAAKITLEPASNQTTEKRKPHVEFLYQTEDDLGGSITCKGSYTCTVSVNTYFAPSYQSDAVVFLAHLMPRLPLAKPSNQLWIMETGESQRQARDLSRWNGYINYTLSFKADADWSIFYASKVKKLKVKTFRNFARERKSVHAEVPSAVWYVSNCLSHRLYGVKSGRVPYAVELAKWMNVSIFTALRHCEKTISWQDPNIIFRKPKDQQPPVSNFHFYLAFENSLCTDYITEKFWKILKGPDLVIPIVMGGLEMEEYERIAPPNSYIHVKNFTSPKHLAEHLKYIVKHEEAFNYYLQWRNEYQLDREGEWPGCQACVLAHQRPQKVWNNLGQHFNQSQCLDMSDTNKHCKYYGMGCASQQSQHDFY